MYSRRTIPFLCLVASTVATADQPAKGPTSVHEFEMRSIDGTPVKLSAYKDHVLVIINVASK